jgi:muramoyltetrapeptide carboxypeptidase
MSKKFPKPLKKGDTIGLISPGSFGDKAILEKGAAFLEQNGYRVVVHPQNSAQLGHLAGADIDKVASLMQMFASPEIDGVLCARGGNGSIRLLDKIDFDLIAKNPKVFVGYSDITVLLQAIQKKCGFTTYHGPMAASFGRTFDPRTAYDFFAQIEGRIESVLIPDVDVLTPGLAEGVLVGGNMTMLQNLIATPFDWQTENAILFIEDVDEVLYRVDRMLHHFRLAGKFKNVAAVLVGEMINVPDSETSHMRSGERPYGYTIKQILRDNLPPNIPVCMNFPCGHAQYITTLPIGAKAHLTLNEHGAQLDFIRV